MKNKEHIVWRKEVKQVPRSKKKERRKKSAQKEKQWREKSERRFDMDPPSLRCLLCDAFIFFWEGGDQRWFSFIFSFFFFPCFFSFPMVRRRSEVLFFCFCFFFFFSFSWRPNTRRVFLCHEVLNISTLAQKSLRDEVDSMIWGSTRCPRGPIKRKQKEIYMNELPSYF